MYRRTIAGLVKKGVVLSRELQNFFRTVRRIKCIWKVHGREPLVQTWNHNRGDDMRDSDRRGAFKMAFLFCVLYDIHKKIIHYRAQPYLVAI